MKSNSIDFQNKTPFEFKDFELVRKKAVQKTIQIGIKNDRIIQEIKEKTGCGYSEIVNRALEIYINTIKAV